MSAPDETTPRKPTIAAYTLKAKLLGNVEVTDPEGNLLFTLEPQHCQLTERLFYIKNPKGEVLAEIRQQHTIFFLHYQFSQGGGRIGTIRTKGVLDHYIYQLEGMPEHDIRTGMGFTSQYVLKSEGTITSIIKVGMDKWTVRTGKLPYLDQLLWCLALTYKNSIV